MEPSFMYVLKNLKIIMKNDKKGCLTIEASADKIY